MSADTLAAPAALRRVLVVKTSSMGDVVHALPAVSDLLAAHPQVRLEWLVEAPFAAIPALHGGVAAVHALTWRRWRRALGRADTWRAMAALRHTLRAAPYDLVVDLQGLLKSALWGLQADGPLAGYDRHSAREPLASLCYSRRAAVPRALQAVERNRRLMAAVAGYPMPASPPDFGLDARAAALPAPEGLPPGAPVLVPGASRPEKFWPEDRWVAIGRELAAHHGPPVVLWGRPDEQAIATRLAAGCGGVVPPFLTVAQVAALLHRAPVVVGLDTGFTHLAAALGRPTLGIYCDHEPGLAGLTGRGPRHSVGGVGQVPPLVEVQAGLRAIGA